MANENINIKYNNICRSPMSGSLCYLNFSDPVEPSLNIVNYTGDILKSFKILGGLDEEALVSFEYVGPVGLDDVLSDSFLYALEKVNEGRCILKIFKFNASFSNLDLFYKKIFYDQSSYSFDVTSMSVEYYHRSFSEHSDRFLDYIYINDTSRLNIGDTLFIGPSSDPEYTGNHDVVEVKDIMKSENKVLITPTIKNQYIIGDPVIFSPSLYFVCKRGINGNKNRGSILKIDNRQHNVVNRDTGYLYKKTRGSKWCSFFNCVGLLFSGNIVFCDPHNYYTNKKSLFLNNFKESKKDFYTIYDIAFVDNFLFKLSNKVTLKDSEGKFTTYNWKDYYNFSRQNLVPYVNTLNIYSDDSYAPGSNIERNLRIRALDQFGTGLRDVELQCNIEDGSSGSELDPSSGFVETDANGRAEIGFVSGDDTYMSNISTMTNEGSSYSGDVNVFSNTNIRNEVEFSGCSVGLQQKIIKTEGNPSPNSLIKQVLAENVNPSIMLLAYSFFSAPGGNWVPGGDREKFDEYLDFLLEKGEKQGFRKSGFGGGSGLFIKEFNKLPNNSEDWDPEGALFIGNRITTISEFRMCNFVTTLNKVYSYHLDNIHLGDDFRDYKAYEAGPWKAPEGTYPSSFIHTIFDEYKLQISQLNYSGHNYVVDEEYEEELKTYITLDQFVFIQDAVPAFYSRKNSVYTDIWLRLRPYSDSLDPDTLRFRIRKISPFGDSGVIDITDDIHTEIYEAGESLNGLELLYEPPERFEYNSIVYVFIEIYDSGGNKIEVDYWFTLIHDYRIPYLSNLKPDRLESEVDPDTNIYFEVLDDETGVDINSLVLTVNSKVVSPTRIDKLNRKHYVVEYEHPKPFLYGKRVDVSVFVGDLASQQNWLRDGYTFYTKKSNGVYLTDYKVGPCKYDVDRYHPISFLALDLGNGVDINKLRLQVRGQDVTKDPKTKILPIIYKVD